VVQSLVGKVSGLQINKSSNGVNATNRIVLRGTRSITGNNEALVVIDNSISSSAALQQLPPELIRSITWSRYAGWCTLWWQGVNGVIIVTTVRKTKGKITVNVNSAMIWNCFPLCQTQNKYGQGWDGVHYLTKRILGTSFWWRFKTNWFSASWRFKLELPYSFIKDNVKDFYQTGTTFQTDFLSMLVVKILTLYFSANKVNTEFVVNGDRLERNSFYSKRVKKLESLALMVTNYTYKNRLKHLRFTWWFNSNC
jgi:hypothetical protein